MNFLNKEVLFTGSQVAYFSICKTKLWLYSHFITMEHNSDIVRLGKIIDISSYSRESKNKLVDQKISIDFIRKKDTIEIHEVKKSNKLEKAHKLQLKYYMYVLCLKGVRSLTGIINYPKLRKIVKVNLSSRDIQQIKNVLKEIGKVVNSKLPPKPIYKPYCRKCSYYNLCYVK